MAAPGGGAVLAAGTQLCLETVPCPMGGGALTSQLDRGQVLGIESAKQLPEALVFTAPPQA